MTTPQPLNELDEILVPVEGGEYKAFNITQIARKMWRAASGFGLAPLHFITQRGPFQDGSTPLDMRYDDRTIQIIIAAAQQCRSEYWDQRWSILDYLRPNRSFGDVVQPLIYRKWLPAGYMQRACDLDTTLGSPIVASVLGRFVCYGLDPGAAFTITTGADAGTYTIVDVPNDYTLQLDANMGATAANVCWEYRRGWGKRDLFCLLESGPTFDEGPGPLPFYPTGYDEVLRFVAHDPFWYGSVEQVETWELPEDFGDLVFDLEGAWFGTTHGDGRWLFAPTSIGESVNVIYWGTRFAKPIIEIDGPAENPYVENTTIGTSLFLNGYTVALGETVTINTLTLTVTNNAGDNLMPYLEGDLAGFGLFPDPQAPGRQNEVFVSFDGATLDSAARLLWRNRDVGI